MRAWNAERSQYGKTSSNQYVDHESLERLCQMGYERCLAAEALRVHDNEQSSALDVLCDPVRRGALQLGMVARQVNMHDIMQNKLYCTLSTGARMGFYWSDYSFCLTPSHSV